MIQYDAQRIEQFLLMRGTIETILVSNKDAVLECDSYTSDNCDADEFLKNMVEYVIFLNSTHINVTCMLVFKHSGWINNENMLLTPNTQIS